MKIPYHMRNPLRGSALTLASALCALLVLASACGYAQVAERLSQVRKVYVDSFGTGHGADEMRQQLVHRLRKSHDIQVVSDPREADALVRGTGRIWVTGYLFLNSRSHSPIETAFGGFLSAEVVGKNGDTLWSYLVTPSRFLWNSITDDLASQIVNKMLASLKEEDQQKHNAEVPVEQVAGTLQGAGATFPALLYQRWFELFQEQEPNVHIRYDAVGSEEGIQRLQAHKVDFAASDMPLSDAVMAESRQRFLHIPAVLGAVVVIYNVNGRQQELNFTPETLSGIFLGRIKKWNDQEIRRSNRGAALPDAEIVVVHRSDGSGTSFIWTDYLSKISSQWKASVGSGTTVRWPVGIGAERNEGVAAAVQQTPNSIGYVEFIYAIQHELSFGAVRNAAGWFIKPSISSVTDAAAGTSGAPGEDLRVSITNSSGKDAYPIASYTWLLLPEQTEDENKKNVEAELLRWVLTTGQKKCSALGYAPLPAAVAKRALESVDRSR